MGTKLQIKNQILLICIKNKYCLRTQYQFPNTGNDKRPYLCTGFKKPM
jgi:hypothetical protein